MQASSQFNTESTTQKKVVYNYKTEKGTYNDDTNKMELVVSQNNNFFMLEDGEMQSYTAKNMYFTKVIHYHFAIPIKFLWVACRIRGNLNSISNIIIPSC